MREREKGAIEVENERGQLTSAEGFLSTRKESDLHRNVVDKHQKHRKDQMALREQNRLNGKSKYEREINSQV